MRRVGLIGNPVSHSRSPLMHNAAFAALGMDAQYELWLTESKDIPNRVASIRETDIAGANVTVPHKQAVMPFLDEISETSARIGAVNTIIRQGDHLIGDNTDAYGFAASINAHYPDFHPGTAVILGAGGASRAVIVALQQMGARNVVIVNRTPEKAEKLANDLGASAADWDDLVDILPGANALINATSLGWHNEIVLPAHLLGCLPQAALVMDLTYRHTPLLQTAENLGIKSLDGLGMLIHQGARSFELWFGVTPPVEVMTTALLS